MAYSVLVLPLLWLWGTRLLSTRDMDPRVITVVVVLILWWLVQTHAWPGDGSPNTISSIQICIVFGANLAACTASVLGAQLELSESKTTHGLARIGSPSEPERRRIEKA